MVLHHFARRVLAVVGLAALMACAQILSLSDFRACEGAECDASTDASMSDAMMDVVQTTCATSSTCPTASPVCSANVCVAVDTLSAGISEFQCAVLSDHTARCWGDGNSAAELGNGQMVAAAAPVTVLNPNGTGPLMNIETIVTGLSYGCALTGLGEVYCWGSDPSAPGIYPTYVLNGATQISGAAGVNPNQGSVCAILGSASLVCWGFNADGRIGCTSSGVDDAGNCTFTPISVPGSASLPVLGQASIVGAGTYVTCSSLDAYNAQCMGNNTYGEFGSGSYATGCCSSGVAGFHNAPIVAIQASDQYMCAVDSSGYWWCWGWSRGGAILHVAPNATVSTPQLVSTDPPTFGGLTAGWAHACAIMAADGSVVCWGQNDHGQMGNGTADAGPPPMYQTTPATATGLSNVKAVAAHRNFTCALNGDGQVYCWGQNPGSLLGAGSPTTDVLTPQLVKWD